jgi:hypothetical protein
LVEAGRVPDEGNGKRPPRAISRQPTIWGNLPTIGFIAGWFNKCNHCNIANTRIDIAQCGYLFFTDKQPCERVKFEGWFRRCARNDLDPRVSPTAGKNKKPRW